MSTSRFVSVSNERRGIRSEMEKRRTLVYREGVRRDQFHRERSVPQREITSCSGIGISKKCGETRKITFATLKPNTTMSVSLFLSLPEDLIRTLTPFFDIRSLVRLDSAVLLKEHRATFLNKVLRGATVNHLVNYDLDMTKWMIARGVHLTMLRFHPRNTELDVKAAIPILSKVHFIDIGSCFLLTNESVQQLLRDCGSKSLKGLGCERCVWLNDETVKVLADHHSQSLEMFFITDCPSVTDAGAAYLLSHCPNIRDVQWERCDIAARAMAALANHSIKTFCAANCPNMLECSVIDFLKGSNGHLQHVVLAQNPQLSDATLMALAHYCPSLKSLVISECEEFGDRGLYAMVLGCQNLRELSASACNVSVKVQTCMGKHISPVLSSLSMVGCPEFKSCHIAALAKRAPLLTEVYLGSNLGLTDRTLKAFGAYCPDLQVMAIDDCEQITSAGISALAKGCPILIDLNITECPNVCDKGLVALAKHCPKLWQLRVAENQNITDQGISALAEHCATLSRINLGYTDITDKAVVHLIRSCAALTAVGIQGREELSKDLVDLAAQRHVTLITEDEDDDEEWFDEDGYGEENASGDDDEESGDD